MSSTRQPFHADIAGQGGRQSITSNPTDTCVTQGSAQRVCKRKAGSVDSINMRHHLFDLPIITLDILVHRSLIAASIGGFVFAD